MKLVVDSLDDVTNWVGTGSVTVGLNEVTDYVAGRGLAGSLLFHFPSGSQGESITKDLSAGPIDVSEYDKLVLSIWSRNRGKTDYRVYSDCNYRLRLTATPDERYIRVWKNFAQEEIDISDIDSIDQITFIAEHDQEDYLLVSLMVAEYQQQPVDLLTGVQEQLDYFIKLKNDPGILLGSTIDGNAGDDQVTLEDDYLDRYAVVIFDAGGASEEKHMLLERDYVGFTFGLDYDGKTLLNDHSASTVHLVFPVEIGGHEDEVRLPGISLWTFTPQPVDRGTDLDETRYNFQPTTTGVQEEGKIMSYPVLIDCEARQYEILELLTERVRAMMSADHTLWINGRKHDIEWTEVPVELDPTEPEDITPKIQYTLNVEIKEELWQRENLPLAGTASTRYFPILQGHGELPSQGS